MRNFHLLWSVFLQYLTLVKLCIIIVNRKGKKLSVPEKKLSLPAHINDEM